MTIFNCYYRSLQQETLAEMESNKEVDEGALFVAREHWKAVYVKVIQEIKKWFIFEDEYFQIAKIVQPVNAHALEPPTFQKLSQRFPDLRKKCNLGKAE